MIRGLKIALLTYGAIHVLFGISFIIAPHQVAITFGIGEIADYVPYLMALLGGAFIAISFLLIVAGMNPLGHITVVKFVILWTILGVVMGLYSIVRGAVDFSVAGTGIIMDAIFAVTFLALYPYRQP